MYTFFQVPILDIRRLSYPQAAILKDPAWPIPKTPSEVRFFGPIVGKNSPLHLFFNENMVCDASNSFSIPRNLFFDYSEFKIEEHCKAKIFHFDGQAKGKFSFLFLHLFHPQKRNAAFVPISNIIERLLNLDVILPNSKTKVPLNDFSTNLANSYYFASTPNSAIVANDSPQMIFGCTSSLFLEYNKNIDKVALDADFIKIANCSRTGIKVYIKDHRIGNIDSKIWVTTYRNNTDYNQVVRLRKNLMRLHAEYEVLRTALDVLKDAIPDDKQCIATCLVYLRKAKKYIEHSENSINRQFRNESFKKELRSIYYYEDLMELRSVVKNKIQKMRANNVKQVNNINYGDIKAGDNSNISVNESTASKTEVPDWSLLQLEIEKVLNTMIDHMKEPGVKDSYDNTIVAKQAANEQNFEKMKSFLKKAGEVLIKFATDIGASLLVKTLLK